MWVQILICMFWASVGSKISDDVALVQARASSWYWFAIRKNFTIGNYVKWFTLYLNSPLFFYKKKFFLVIVEDIGLPNSMYTRTNVTNGALRFSRHHFWKFGNPQIFKRNVPLVYMLKSCSILEIGESSVMHGVSLMFIFELWA